MYKYIQVHRCRHTCTCTWIPHYRSANILIWIPHYRSVDILLERLTYMYYRHAHVLMTCVQVYWYTGVPVYTGVYIQTGWTDCHVPLLQQTQINKTTWANTGHHVLVNNETLYMNTRHIQVHATYVNGGMFMYIHVWCTVYFIPEGLSSWTAGLNHLLIWIIICLS